VATAGDGEDYEIVVQVLLIAVAVQSVGHIILHLSFYICHLSLVA
jgi:hypothetical protein